MLMMLLKKQRNSAVLPTLIDAKMLFREFARKIQLFLKNNAIVSNIKINRQKSDKLLDPITNILLLIFIVRKCSIK